MRPIDADALIEAHYDYCNKHHGEADVFYGWSLELMRNAPTVKRIKGEWTTEEVAEILASVLGDECACSFSGIDEWLPSACKYADTECPTPKEKHGCWMQFLMQGGADMRGEQDEV